MELRAGVRHRVRVAFLFPGQGAQSTGFLHRLPQHPTVKRTLEEAATHLQCNPLTLDSTEALESTVASQLSILIAGVATTRTLAAYGVLPDIVAGHSVGAFAAAVATEALRFPDAIRLVRLRAQCMQRAYPSGYGMAAIVGLSQPAVQRIIGESVSFESRIYLAAVNAPQQFVVCGTRASLELATRAAKRAGAIKAMLLAVPVPSHCELMNHVSEEIRQQLESIALTEPRIPYVCNHTARAVSRAQDIREDLIRGISNTVLWHDCTTLIVELGTILCIEVPPGRALTDLLGAAFPDLRAMAVSDSAIESAALLTTKVRSTDSLGPASQDRSME
jgi:malonate decarboxylase epsilon subunit